MYLDYRSRYPAPIEDFYEKGFKIFVPKRRGNQSRNFQVKKSREQDDGIGIKG